MNRLQIVFALVLLARCGDRQDYEVSEYLTPALEQSLLQQSVRYMYYAEGIPAALRFDSTYDIKYKSAARAFRFARYSFSTPDGTQTFLMLRKYPGEKYRAIVGILETDNNNLITRFEEKLVTPLATQDDALEKGGFLFRQLVENGSIDPQYYKMKSYIEWPDADTKYDTALHEWRRTP